MARSLREGWMSSMISALLLLVRVVLGWFAGRLLGRRVLELSGAFAIRPPAASPEPLA